MYYDSVEVTPSGSIGKQVFATDSSQKVLCGATLTTTVSAGVLVIRSGNASGDVILKTAVPAGESFHAPLKGVRFDRGMHVKVTPADATAYLILK